jgi:hypothetical protein
MGQEATLSGVSLDCAEHDFLKVDARGVLSIREALQLMNMSIAEPEQESHPMLKTSDCRSDTT